MEANEDNFSAALTQYFDKRGDLCFGIGRWPVDFSEDESKPIPSFGLKISQVQALEKAGLATSVSTETDTAGLWGKRNGEMMRVKRYSLTDVAKPFVREREGLTSSDEETSKFMELCWGKKALDKIEKWKGPIKLGDYQEAGIIYTYKVDNIADWAQKNDMQTAFTEIRAVLEGAGRKRERHGVLLTSQGWESKRLE